ncbi:unnamed protein product [Ilex paraguariensis]|uniref:18S pre-ribosomal assembly protein gar2-related n=1 Tax=Ilex paraguariensis TaxID=185542 RepID=A0ABC8RIF9_9AQUA
MEILYVSPPNTLQPKGTMMENQNGILCHNSYGRDADTMAPKTNHEGEFWKNQELNCSGVMDDFTNSNENDMRDSLIKANENEVLCPSNGCGRHADSSKSDTRNRVELWSADQPECSVVLDDFTEARCTTHSDWFEKDMNLCNDKNVMQCHLPELYVVKDICIDEGVLSDDKILIESSEVDHTGHWNSLISAENKISVDAKESVDIELLIPDRLNSSPEKYCDKDASKDCEAKERTDIEFLIPDGLKSSSKVDIHKDAAKECGPEAEDSAQMFETDCNAIDKEVDDAPREEFVPSGMLPEHEFGTETSLESLLKISDCDGNEVAEQSCQIPCAEAVVDSPVVVSADEDSNKNGVADTLSCTRKVESRTSSRDEKPENDHEQPKNVPESKKEPNHGDMVSDNVSLANQVQRGEGQSSFSMAGTMSGLITYSGPIAYSGSNSLRSDSSTTSTRSFAFPILQPEWSSSPVRMVKADQKHHRKRRSWMQSLLCCRF